MARRKIEPIVETPESGGSVSRHPAFAQIGVYRSQGRAVLNGSDFVHRSFMAIRIQESAVHRTLSRDWHSSAGGRVIAEVQMSEAQWATFVSTPNSGDGVPCTLTFRETTGEVPGLPDPASRVHQFSGEMKETLGDAIGHLRTAAREADRSRSPKAVKDAIAMAIQEIEKNIPFVADQFGEHMEGVVEKAKTEVHGWMEGAIRRAGLDAIKSEAPLQLEGPTDGE